MSSCDEEYVAVTLTSIFRYMYTHSVFIYLNSIYLSEFEIKQIMKSSISTSCFEFVQNIHVNGKLATPFQEKGDDVSFSIVIFPHLCSNIQLPHPDGVFVFLWIKYPTACPAYDRLLKRDMLLRNELILQGFRCPGLTSAFRDLEFLDCYDL